MNDQDAFKIISNVCNAAAQRGLFATVQDAAKVAEALAWIEPVDKKSIQMTSVKTSTDEIPNSGVDMVGTRN